MLRIFGVKSYSPLLPWLYLHHSYSSQVPERDYPAFPKIELIFF